MMAVSLTPIVRWAENGDRIDLTVDLLDVKDPVIDITESKLSFQGYGKGAHGENIYNFTLEFFREINKEKCSTKISDRNVSFVLPKKNKEEIWARLLKQESKPAWLKVDFDKWKIEDSEDEAPKEENPMDQINKISFETRMKSEIEKAQHDIKIYAKIAYLTIYNLLQAICFASILFNLISGVIRRGKDALYDAYEHNSDLILTCQIAAFLEIINPLVGVVKTGLIAPVFQVLGRNFVLMVLIVPVKEMHNDPTVFFLFFFWSLTEVVRYPFYILGLYRYDSRLLYWLRYNIWIPLYPAGMTTEATIVIKSIHLSYITQRWSYALPNVLNFQFNLSMLLVCYLFVFLPTCMYLLSHMYKLRQKKMGSRKKVKSKQL